MNRPTPSSALAALALGGALLLGGAPGCARPDDGAPGSTASKQAQAPPSEAPPPAQEAPPPSGEMTSSTQDAPPGQPGDSSAVAEQTTPPQGEENPAMSTTGTYRGLTPFPGVQAPAITEVHTVRFQTDEGDLTLEIYPQAAPNAARQFLELVKAGFYDETPIFRIVPGFVAQFGINWRGDMPKWKDKNFRDDPSLFRLEPGTLAFAKAGPNTNSTQVFINYGDNSPLKDQGGFTTFGKVIQGFSFAKNFKAVGDPSMGLDQGRLWSQGGTYLEGLPAHQKPTMIKKAELVADPS